MNKQIHRTILLSLAFMSTYSCIGQKQDHIGAMVGPSAGEFVDFYRNDDYESHYALKPGASIETFYEIKIDSTTDFRIGLQYQYQKAKFEVQNHYGNSSFYNNTNFTLNQFKLNLNYYFHLMDSNHFGLQFLFGVSGGYNFNSSANGEGWDLVSVTQTDTSGNNVSLITEKPWQKNERHSKDLNPLFVNLNIGFAATIPLNDRVNFILQNDYSLCVSQILHLNGIRSTSFLTGGIKFGVSYSFNKS